MYLLIVEYLDDRTEVHGHNTVEDMEETLVELSAKAEDIVEVSMAILLEDVPSTKICDLINEINDR